MSKANLAVTPVGGDVIDTIVSGLFKLDAQRVGKLKNVLLPQGIEQAGAISVES
jgi:hypothetical protein